MKKIIAGLTVFSMLVSGLASLSFVQIAKAYSGSNTDTIGPNATNTSSGQPGYIFAGQITATASGSLQTIGVDMQTGGNGNVTVAIYSDNNGSAGTLLAQSSSVPTTTGWDNVPVSGVKIVSGTAYWLAEEFDNAADVWYYTAGTGALITQSYGSFPSSPTWSPNSNIIEADMTYAHTGDTLSGLTLSPGSLDQTFSPTTLSYTASVANSVASVTLTPTPTDSNATITVNGVSATTPVSLPEGVSTKIPVVVSITNSSTNQTYTQTYTVTVTRAPSADATLSNLTVDQGTLNSTGSNSYSVSVPASVTSLNVTPTTNDSNATVTVNNQSATSGSPSNVLLNYGSTTITVTVIAQDGSTQQSYTISVSRGTTNGIHANTLTSLTVDNQNASTTPSTTVFTENVPASQTTSTIVPVLANSRSSFALTDNGGPLTANVDGSYTLAYGTNAIVLTVTPTNVSYSNTYDISITRGTTNGVHGDTLSGLTISPGTLDQTFSPTLSNYTASVANSVSSVTLSPTLTNAKATVTVNGVSATTPVSLPEGASTKIPVVVSIVASNAQTYTQTYTVIVTRAPSTDATLSALSTSDSSSLSPAFDPATTSYTDILPYGTTVAPSLIAKTNDANATAVVTPATSTSGSATVVVTPQDLNAAPITYTVNFSVAVAGVSLSEHTKTLAVGDVDSLTATIDPTNASNQAVTYSSSDPSIASVDSNGVITANAVGGPVDITVKTADGGFTDTDVITVAPASADITFSGLNNLTEGTGSQVSANVANLAYTGSKYIDYKLTLTNGVTGIAGQTIYYPEAGDNLNDVTTWHSFTTDANGVAYFGPPTGFQASALPSLATANGITTPFYVNPITWGPMTLEVDIVDASNNNVLVSGTPANFTVTEISTSNAGSGAAITSGGGSSSGGSSSGGGGGGGSSAPTTPVVTPTAPVGQVLGASTSVYDGALVSQNGTVYLIQNGELRPFAQAAEFLSYGFKFSEVQPINNAEQTLPIGSMMTFMPGSVVVDTATGNHTIYFIDANGAKHGFATWAAFIGQGYNATMILKGNLSSYASSTNIENGTDIHGNGAAVLIGGTVYIMGSGTRSGVASLAALTSRYYQLKNVVAGNSNDAAATLGATLN